ncbi:MAG: hypothetical protein IPL96_14680 [Holophagaceae bacterium]|nr:hypothetical protein [Holophagaceae bacterium]
MQASGRDKAIGLAAVLFVSLGYFLQWWNAFAPPTAGGEVLMMQPWGQEFLPYRDYFFQAPPGLPILAKLISAVTGPRLIGLLGFGVLLRTAGAVALYLLLCRVVRPAYAAVATLLAVIIASTDISDVAYYYNQLSMALVLLGTCAGLRSAGDGRAIGRIAGILCGGLMTFAVLIKQTMLFGAAAAGLAMLLIIFPRPKVGWWRWLGTMAGGAFLVLAGAVAWLIRNGIFHEFLEQMRRAPEGKGGVIHSMGRPITLLFDYGMARQGSLSLLAVAIVALLGIWWRRHLHQAELKPVTLAWIAGPLALLVSVSLGLNASAWSLRDVTLLLTGIGWWGCLAIIGSHFSRGCLTDSEPRVRCSVALAVLAFGIGYSFAVSWPLFEHMANPGLGLWSRHC